MIAFVAGVCVGAAVAIVGVLTWAAWSVAREIETAILGDDGARG